MFQGEEETNLDVLEIHRAHRVVTFFCLNQHIWDYVYIYYILIYIYILIYYMLTSNVTSQQIYAKWFY